MASHLDLRLAHELDAAWIIALYLAIHGGDPPPEHAVPLSEATIAQVAALGAHLREAHALPGTQELSMARLRERLKTFGIDVVEGEAATAGAQVERTALAAGPAHEPPPWCFVYRGQRICIRRPRVQPPIQ